MMKTTTVAVKEDTFKLLQKAKEQQGADSLNTVILNLLAESKKPKASLFGALKGLRKEFKREELDRFG